MAYGIGQQLDDASKLSIKELVQLQSVDPSLIYTLALQEKQKLQAAANNQEALSMQTPQSTITNQMEGRMPGVQMAAARTAPRPQMARGIAAAPAQNMQAIGRAQGGIIGYAQGGMSKVGTKSKGPIPQMSPEENVMMLEYLKGLKKFDYYDKNPDKVSPQGRQALELERRMFEEKYPSQFKQKVSDMMYGPSKGMAMGGEIKGYAGPDGSLVGSDEYLIGDRPVSKEEYDAYLAFQDSYNALSENEKMLANQRSRLNSRMAPEKEPEIKFYTGPNGERLTEDDVRMMMRRNEVGENFTRTDNEMRRQRAEAARREEAESQRRIEEDGPRQNPVVAALTALSEPVGEALKPVGGAINRGLTAIAEDIIPDVIQEGKLMYNDGLTALKNRAAEQEAERAFNAEQAQADAIGMRPPTREQALRELLQPLMDNKKSVDNAMADITGVDKGQSEEITVEEVAKKDPPKEGGIRSVLSKTNPFLDKAMGIAEVLGRGAGASKGFEGARIVEESAKIRGAEADRDARMAEQRALIEARKAELDARLASDTALAMQELDSELYTTITQELESGPLAEELEGIEEDLRDKYSAFSIPLLGDFFVKDGVVDKELAVAKLDIIRREFRNRKGVLASLPGMSGQGGAGESIIEYTQLPE